MPVSIPGTHLTTNRPSLLLSTSISHPYPLPAAPRSNVPRDGFLRAIYTVKGQPLEKCHLLKTEAQCLSRYGRGFPPSDEPGAAQEGARPSCIWRTGSLTGSGDVREAVRIHSWGSGSGQSRKARGPGKFNFRGSLCRVTVTAVLPPASSKKWGAYVSLGGGPMPYSIAESEDLSETLKQAIYGGCFIAPGDARRSCSFTLEPPPRYARDYRFVNNSMNVGFFLTDAHRIAQLTGADPRAGANAPRELSPANRVFVDLKTHWHSCGASTTTPKTTKKAPLMVDDSVVFGPTDFSLEDYPFSGRHPRAYFSVPNRAYLLSDVSGLDFEVKAMPLGPSKKPANLTVFVAEENGDFSFSTGCITAPGKPGFCAPPVQYRVAGSAVCRGAVCRGSLRGLNPSMQHFLYVSYPDYPDPIDYEANFKRTKLKAVYPPLRVSVKAWARRWELGPVVRDPGFF